MFLIDDFLQAWRGLRHSPAFLILASSVLALGLGATIFTYGIINTTSRKPPESSATTGSPQRCASTATSPSPSSREGTTSAVALR